jgi:ABC-type transporter Mla subunit MlaD
MSDQISDENQTDTAPDSSRNSIDEAIEELALILEKTDARVRRPAILEGALWYLVTIAAVMLSTIVLALLAPAALPVVTRWTLTIGLGAATLGALVALATFEAQRGDLGQIASRLQRYAPMFRNDINAALEFAETLHENPDASENELGFSRAMARAHIHRTVERVRAELRDGHLGHLFPRRDFTAPAMSLAGALVLLAVPVAVDADWTHEVLMSPLAEMTKSTEDAPDIQPIVGDIGILYSHPAYTGQGKRFDSFSTGQVEAVEGTEVTIKATPLMQTERIVLLHKTGGEVKELKMKPAGSGVVEASFVALESGSYQFRAHLPDGEVVQDGVDRPIRVEPDKAPDVAVTSHSGEVEVSPEDVLEIDFDVSDDYGIGAVNRVHYFAGDEENASRNAVDIPGLDDVPKSTSGTIEFDLKPLALQPKDVVIFRIEATDNNTVTGPGVGSSESLVLRVSSPEDKHLENIAQQQQLLEELLMLLADYLENPVGERQPTEDGPYRQVVTSKLADKQLASRVRDVVEIHDKEGELLGRMEKLVKRLEEDPLMLERDMSLFEGLYKELRELHEDGGALYSRYESRVESGSLGRGPAQNVADHVATTEDVLEKGLLRLEELLASQKMEAIKATAEDIKELKNRLKDLLKKYKETRDPELKKAIMREIKRLRQRMHELTSRMQMQLQKLPQEHMNMQAINQKKMESDTKKMSDSLRSIEEMLEQDDIDGALEALENMDAGLDSLTQDMNEQFGQAQPEGLRELDKKVSELMDQVNDLQQAEKQLEKDTQKLNEQMSEERKKKVEQMLDEFTKKMTEQVDRQLSELDDIARKDIPKQQRESIRKSRESLQQLREMLEQQDIAQSLEEAEDSLRKMRRMRYSMDLAQRYKSKRDPQTQELEDAKQKVRGMESRGEKMVEDLEDMMQKAQEQLGQMGGEKMEKLAERQRRISEQGEKLEKQIGEASKRFPMLQQQLQPSMKESQKAMKEAEDSLRQGQQQRALDSERKALEQLGKLKQQMKQAVRKQKQRGRQGRQGTRQEDVKIPGDDDENVADDLREDVMKGMKQEKLEDYESEIKRYYKSIVE